MFSRWSWARQTVMRLKAACPGLCASLGEPVPIGDATFQLTPYAGVSILGQDGSSPRGLLEKARSACAEARRSNSSRVFFFSDSMKLRSLQRLDIAREIRDAIENRDIRLRYGGRHELASGRLVAHVGYLKWTHRLRGELTAGEFLGAAETTGLAAAMSRALLTGLRDDFAATGGRRYPPMRAYRSARCVTISCKMTSWMTSAVSWRRVACPHRGWSCASRSVPSPR